MMLNVNIMIIIPYFILIILFKEGKTVFARQNWTKAGGFVFFLKIFN